MPDEQTASLNVLTADIGGSHITAGIYDSKTGFILSETLTRAEVASKGSADEILAAWSGCLRKVLSNSSTAVAGLTLAMPGPFDYKNGISRIKGLNKYESIFGMNIREYLAGALGIEAQRILFRNDAESTIAGEALSGAGRHNRKVMGITLGTGFGSAFADHSITKDLNFGSDKYRDSIADDYFSTRWFVRRYKELSGKNLSDGVRELASLSAEDNVSKQIFREFTDNLSEFLATRIETYRPDALIICGNIAKASKLFLPQLKEKTNTIAIELAELGENAPLIGAASIIKNYITD